MDNLTHYETIKQPTHVLCDWPNCSTVVRADDAHWDDDTDSPYCSREHYEQAHNVEMSKQYAFEDYYLGYTDEYESPYAEDIGTSGYKPWTKGVQR